MMHEALSLEFGQCFAYIVPLAVCEDRPIPLEAKRKPKDEEIGTETPEVQYRVCNLLFCPCSKEALGHSR